MIDEEKIDMTMLNSNNEIYEEWRKIIGERRYFSNLTLKAMADKIGYSATTYRTFEKGVLNTRTRGPILLYSAEYFGLTDALLYSIEIAKRNSKKDILEDQLTAMRNNYSKLDKEIQSLYISIRDISMEITKLNEKKNAELNMCPALKKFKENTENDQI